MEGGGWGSLYNPASLRLHLASWNLLEFQLSWDSKMEPSVAKTWAVTSSKKLWLFNIGMSLRRCSQSLFRCSNGNNVCGHYFFHYFPSSLVCLLLFSPLCFFFFFLPHRLFSFIERVLESKTYMGDFTQPQQKYAGTGENCNPSHFLSRNKTLWKFLCV